MNNLLVRSISVLLIGILMMILGNQALNILVVLTGVLFIIPGVVSLVSYFRKKETYKRYFPFDGIGSLLLGLWLVMAPNFFVSIFMYLLGAVIVFLGIYQLVTLAATSRMIPVSPWWYVLPVLVLIVGLFVLFNPFEAASVPFILIGVGCIISAISDLVQLVRVKRNYHPNMPGRDIEDAEIVD